MLDLDKKQGIKENLIAEIGVEETKIIWNRAKEILTDTKTAGRKPASRAAASGGCIRARSAGSGEIAGNPRRGSEVASRSFFRKCF